MPRPAQSWIPFVTWASLWQILSIFIKIADSFVDLFLDILNLVEESPTVLGIPDSQSKRVRQVDRIVVDVGIEINASPEAERVFACEATGTRVIVPRSVGIQPGLAIELAPTILEGVGDCPGGARDFPK